ncbi:hypothetical protein Goklo_000639, partial [Gossypium klotzschianum]|nr:hypothetical protein [Gossypium klotzschianum]
RWWRGEDLRCTHFIFHAASVLLLWKTRSVQSADWGAVCGDFLGAAPKMIYEGRIKMAWIRKNFVELVEDSTETQRERYTQVYILQIIGGILMPDKSQNLIHLRWPLKLVNFRGAGELS